MEPIVLSTKKQLDIYMNPQRQALLRCMRVAGVPMTPKQLADRMGISASAVQHHMAKLLELGLVALDHTEQVRGITARYYRLLPRTVSIGAQFEDDLDAERFALMQGTLSAAFEGFREYCRFARREPANGQPTGDMLSGIVHLSRQEAEAVYRLIRGFVDSHESSGQGTEPWEYALIAYPVGESEDA